MRRFGLGFLILATAAGVATAAAAEEGSASDPPPSLEYRPQRVVIPEPKAPTPAAADDDLPGGHREFRHCERSRSTRRLDVATDADGDFYVLDAGNNRVQKFDRFSNYKLSCGSRGNRDGEFNNPEAIAVDSTRSDFDYIFVVDTGNHRIQIFRSRNRPARSPSSTSWGRLGSRDGDFKFPRDIVLDGEGNIWVLDPGNERVQKFKYDFDRTPGFATMERRSCPGSASSAAGARPSAPGGQFDDLFDRLVRERLGYIYLLGAGCLVQQFQLATGTLVNSWPAIAPESGLCVAGTDRDRLQIQLRVRARRGNSLLSCLQPGRRSTAGPRAGPRGHSPSRSGSR